MKQVSIESLQQRIKLTSEMMDNSNQISGLLSQGLMMLNSTLAQKVAEGADFSEEEWQAITVLNKSLEDATKFVKHTHTVMDAYFSELVRQTQQLTFVDRSPATAGSECVASAKESLDQAITKIKALSAK